MDTSNTATPGTPIKFVFTPYQKFVIGILAFLQFTIILDFMIMSPLGAIMMPALNMTPAQFGLVVSAYAFSAGISGILAAGFADSFDRKKILMFFYVGFLVGTFLCGAANSYEFLLGARIVTGIFGGVVGSVVLAITTDLFAFQQRGRVMGFIQTAFAASQVLGIPISLYLANKWNWHMPFMMIVAIGALAGLLILLKLKPIAEHLKIKSDRNPVHHLWLTVKSVSYLTAFSTSALMSLGGFMLMPFMSAFTVNNVGIDMEHLPMIYLITGLSAIFTGPLVGKAADKYGKFKVFLWGAIFTIITVNIFTHLGVTPLWIVITINVVMFASIFSRMIPSQALISSIPEPQNRGSFMAVNSSLQQISGGVASMIAGLIVVIHSNGRVEHFEILGYLLVATTLISVYLMYVISRRYEK
ncbi:MFS transporter [bacterium]|nr:MFS transporter [bacterium]